MAADAGGGVWGSGSCLRGLLEVLLVLRVAVF